MQSFVFEGCLKNISAALFLDSFLISGKSLFIFRDRDQFTAVRDGCPIVAGHVDRTFPVGINFDVEVKDIVGIPHVEFVLHVMFFPFVDDFERFVVYFGFLEFNSAAFTVRNRVCPSEERKTSVATVSRKNICPWLVARETYPSPPIRFCPYLELMVTLLLPLGYASSTST